LVDSSEFLQAFRNDVYSAGARIYIQAMTFEGDEAGKSICNALLQSDAKDIRIMVDSYTKIMISDKFVYSPINLLDRSFRAEIKETHELFVQLNQAGIKVKYINPLGPLLSKLMIRNHKKLIIIDDRIAYVGGVNFSDHNFSWHDMMLRIEDEDIAAFLLDDYLATWTGENRATVKSFPNIDFYVFDGQSNESIFRSLFQIIDSAKASILIETPYLSFPFYEKLRQAVRRKVDVRIIAPENNNKPIMQKYTFWETQRSGIHLHLLKNQMTHLKAMLIDDEALILGSSNFDYVSYKTQQELVAVIRDRMVIDQFKRRIWQPDLENTREWTGRVSKWLGNVRYFNLKTLGRFLVWLAKKTE